MELNGLYIIGNGFYLAHGLPTSYQSFLDNYWKVVQEKIVAENAFTFLRFEDNFIKIEKKMNTQGSWCKTYRNLYELSAGATVTSHCFSKISFLKKN